jgi:hypothetical protein
LSADLPREWAAMSGTSSLIALEEGFSYNNTDDLTWKWDAGFYVYPPVSAAALNPHAPRKIGSDDITWDADGNMIGRGGKTFAYSLDGKIVTADVPVQTGRRRAVGRAGQATHAVVFDYDADDSRVREATGNGVTIYIGSLAECRADSGCVDHIYAGSERVGSGKGRREGRLLPRRRTTVVARDNRWCGQGQRISLIFIVRDTGRRNAAAISSDAIPLW